MGLVSSGKCKSKARLVGKTAVVTGCNTGIGRPTVLDFVKRGCRVVMACRNVAKAETTATEIRQDTQGVKGVGEIVVVCLDLSSFASVRHCADHLLKTEPHIDLLINNAGVAYCPKNITEDGFETHFATNHLGHFLFTLLLLPRILNSAPARIVTVASMLHVGGDLKFDDINMDKSYSPLAAYNRSKLANVLFSKELSNRLKDRGVTTYSLHPGAVDTDVVRHMDTAFCSGSEWFVRNVVKVFIKTAVQGAQTTIYCAVEEKVANQTGLYYSDCKKTKPSKKARDPALALRLWEESLKWVGLENYDPFTAEDRPPSAHKDDKTNVVPSP